MPEKEDLWLELLVENLGRAFMTREFERHLQVGRPVLAASDGAREPREV
jgi:hypothetical protein